MCPWPRQRLPSSWGLVPCGSAHGPQPAAPDLAPPAQPVFTVQRCCHQGQRTCVSSGLWCEVLFHDFYSDRTKGLSSLLPIMGWGPAVHPQRTRGEGSLGLPGEMRSSRYQQGGAAEAQASVNERGPIPALSPLPAEPPFHPFSAQNGPPVLTCLCGMPLVEGSARPQPAAAEQDDRPGSRPLHRQLPSRARHGARGQPSVLSASSHPAPWS